MALLSIAPLQRFLDSASSEHVYTGTKALVFGFLRAMQAESVYLFLMLKRHKLFPYSKGDPSSEAVAAGQRLRNWCREIWQEQTGNTESLYELSSWEWRRKRFVREFDRMLTQRVGTEGLNETLKEMGTRLESWLPACEN